MDDDAEEAEDPDATAETRDDGDDEETELRDLDPNAEDEARRVDRQLRRIRRETRS